MDRAILYTLAWSALAGVVTSLLTYGILALKLFRLQIAVASLREAMISIANKGKADMRWKKQDGLEQELAAFQKTGASRNERFANDPLPYG